MLWESNAKENDNFAIKVISTKNVDGESSIFKKNVEEVTRKNQTSFFSKLLPWAFNLKDTFYGKFLYFKTFDP